MKIEYEVNVVMLKITRREETGKDYVIKQGSISHNTLKEIKDEREKRAYDAHNNNLSQNSRFYMNQNGTNKK